MGVVTLERLDEESENRLPRALASRLSVLVADRSVLSIPNDFEQAFDKRSRSCG